jgi:hypothetical protein
VRAGALRFDDIEAQRRQGAVGSTGTQEFPMPFHEIRFPDAISRGARGGPERRTQIVELASGDEERSASWANSRRGSVRRTQLEPGRAVPQRATMPHSNPFRFFKTSPEIIRLAVMLYIRFPLSLRNVEDLLTSAASRSATRRCGTGGTGSARCSPRKSGGGASSGCACRRSGGGTWTRCS